MKNCENCKKEFKRKWPYQQKKARFCSRKCCNEIKWEENKFTEEHKQKLQAGRDAYVYTSETKEKMSRIKKAQFESGLEVWNKGKKQWIGEARSNLVVPVQQKEAHWNWKGGITNENISARQNEEYSQWRVSVLKRDDFTCSDCQIRGGKLVAHHIKFFSTHPELRYEVENGVTMCRGCHSRLHNTKVT